MNRRWRKIKGYEDQYEVSDYGEVRRKGGVRGAAHGHIVAVWNNRTARSVALCKDNTCKAVNLAKLVLEAFVGPRKRGYVPGFRDGDRNNCHVENLYWKRMGENVARGTAHFRCKLTDAQVQEIRQIYHDPTRRTTQATLAKQYGVSRTTISGITQGVTRTGVKGAPKGIRDGRYKDRRNYTGEGGSR